MRADNRRVAGHNDGMETDAERWIVASMSIDLRTVAVDLTPVLPGGENGGAKIVILELLRALAVLAPRCRFVLLTQAASHAELAELDAPNVERRLVLGQPAPPPRQRLVSRIARRVLPLLPGRVRTIVARVGYRLHRPMHDRPASRLLRDLGVDVLFCPFTAPTCAEPGIAVVSLVHDLQYRTYPQFFTPDDVAHRDRTFVAACRAATLLVAISDYTRGAILRHGDVEPSRVRTIHHRLALRGRAPDSARGAALLQRLGLRRERYFVYPANFWKHKNHEMLFTAFAVSAQRGLPADVRLVCTGAPGPRQEFLQRAAGAMNLDERIVFAGYLPGEELAALVGNSLGMVFPSLYEGFGLPVLEAMAAGVPVACSNRTALPEIAGDAAILFDPRLVDEVAAAMVALAIDPRRRAYLVRSGRERAAEFSDLGRMAQDYLDAFGDALRGRQRRDAIDGVHADGWAGSRVVIEALDVGCTPVAELDVEAPGWLPVRTLTLAIEGGTEAAPRRLELARGERATVSLALAPQPGRLVITITPVYAPALLGISVDEREIALRVHRCTLRSGDGSGDVTLMPETAA